MSRLAAPVCVLCLGALSALPPSLPVSVATAPVASSGWLTRLNTWRANTGLPLLTENTTWSPGDYDHAQYMVMNDLVTHYETSGTPYYTVAGDTAARNGNIFVSSTTSTTDDQAIDWWMQAPFHAMGMMDPRLTQTGFGSYRYVKSGWDMGAALDVIRGNSFTGGQYPVYFPGNGATEPLTSYGGGEFPDPLQACPGYTVPTGLPVFIQVGGNVSTTADPVHTFTGNGVPLAHCVIDSTNATLGSYLTTRGGVIVIPEQPLQAGVKYTVALTVNGVPYSWSFTVGPFAGCLAATLTAAPGSATVAGTNVTVTASAPGCAAPLYQFWTLAPGATSWQVAQPYSTNNTFSWNTGGLANGAYQVAVWVKGATSPGIYSNSLGTWDAFSSIDYSLVPARCTGVTLSATPAAAAGVGSAVTFTAAGACPDASPLYEFWVLAPGASSWTVAQPYSTSSTLSWSTAGKAPGRYEFAVWARDANSAGAYSNSFGSWDAFGSLSYAVTTCTGLSLTAAPATSAGVGSAVTVGASTSGCPNASPQYQFWVLAPDATSWTVAQPYSASSTLSWTTAGKVPGSYRIGVWGRDADSAGAHSNSFGSWDVFGSFYYSVTTCTGLSLSTTPSSSAAVATSVTVTATASGCPNPSPQYQFWVLAPGASSWTVVQAYSTGDTFTWSTAGKTAGTYQVAAWVRDASSGGAYANSFGTWDVFTATPFDLS